MTQPPPSTTDTFPPPTRVADRYRLSTELGRGGMAVVHRATDEVLQRAVAVKLLHAHLSADARVLDRFRREAQAAAALTHPGVVAVHDWGVDGDTPYLVMELVEGSSLRAVLELRGRLRPGEVLALLTPAIAGLAAAHANGLVHRDVTPSNILLTEDGLSKLGDFGLARSVAATSATFTGAIVGSPHYLSPEAVRGEPLDARADVYSLGCVIYECLTGRRPFEGDSAIAIAARHGVDTVPPPSRLVPSLSPALDAVVARATALDPDDRPADAGQLAQLLAAAVPDGPEPVDLRGAGSALVVLPEHATRTLHDLGPTTVIAGARTGTDGSGKPRRARARWRQLLVGLVVLALAAGGGWLAWDRVIAPVEQVPSVLGLRASDARQLLEGAGFEVRVSPDREHDRLVEEGAVLRQLPDDVARLRSTIELVLSAGPRTGELPPLVGRDETDARAAIEELALDLSITTTGAFDDDVPAGRVLAAEPAGGATVAEGTEVRLVVSEGPAPVEVPDVVGMLEGEATAELVALGLVVSVGERRNDDTPAGTVIAVSPKVGATVHRGDELVLTVSDGPEPVEVPDVEGRREAQAIRILEDAGFVVDVRYVTTLLPFSAGIVNAQDPSPGTVRPKGDTVRIFVWR